MSGPGRGPVPVYSEPLPDCAASALGAAANSARASPKPMSLPLLTAEILRGSKALMFQFSRFSTPATAGQAGDGLDHQLGIVGHGQMAQAAQLDPFRVRKHVPQPLRVPPHGEDPGRAA